MSLLPKVSRVSQVIIVDYIIINGSSFYNILYFVFCFIDSIFSVHIVKGPRGLGLSVSGGTDSTAPFFPGLIRIKRLFPHQAAWSIGVLKQGDIILAVNGVQLTGLTNYVSKSCYIYFFTQEKNSIFFKIISGGIRSIKNNA